MWPDLPGLRAVLNDFGIRFSNVEAGIPTGCVKLTPYDRFVLVCFTWFLAILYQLADRLELVAQASGLLFRASRPKP
jgi:hypothetical protein